MNMIEKRKQARGQGGFTLIELLVVIAILAVLAGVAVFAVGNLTDGADENACKVEKSTFLTANAAAEAKGAGNQPEDYLDAGSITGEGTATVAGKYWQMPNTDGGGTGPVARTGVTLPGTCA
jgi:type IV pilus assembly protein PilA